MAMRGCQMGRWYRGVSTATQMADDTTRPVPRINSALSLSHTHTHIQKKRDTHTHTHNDATRHAHR